MNITNRTIHDVQQGTGPWLTLREGHNTASEAPAALGVSKYVTRAELLRRKHTGVGAEPDGAMLGRFEAGHAAEARARPPVEGIVGDELFPVTVTCEVDGLKLLASLDGLTMDESIAWETKLWNEELAAAVRAGELPAHYTVQMDQALLVTGAERCLFTCTDGTPERFVSCWYERDESKFAALLDGWRGFIADLATYTLPPSTEAAPVGKAPETLPALRIEVTGQVTASNLAEFKATALGAIRSVNRDLRTDQDFADAEKAVKWCADVEARLKAAKEHALSQTASIDALFKALDDISAEARTVRLDLDKLVARRKTEVKEEAVAKARKALDEHIARLQAEIAPFRLPTISADFAGTIKGLKSVASMQDKLDGLLATTKIAAEADARAIRANVATFKAEAGDYEFLFADLGQVIHKAADDFKALVQGRIAQHKVAEVERERKKREAEELARQQAEARAAEQRRQAEEAQRLAAEASARAAAAAPPAAPIVPPQPAVVSQSAPIVPPVSASVPAPRADEPATLKLGDINERLAPLQISAAGLVILGIHPAATQGASKLYRPSDYDRVLRAIAKHVNTLQAVEA